jgi:transcription antitermination factor NusG
MIPQIKNDLNWCVVYTLPKCERKVASLASKIGVEAYLPLQTEIRRWSDRKKKIEAPVFPNYVFVKIYPKQKSILLAIRELVNFVSIENRPVVVRQQEIDVLKAVLDNGDHVVPENYFNEGMTVRIKGGQFQGLEGVLIQKNSSSRFVVRVEGIMKAYSFNISGALLEPVN